MRRFGAIAAAVASLAALWAASPAQASFGLHGLDVTFSGQGATTLSQAGAHPFAMETDVAANTRPEPLLGIEVPDGEVKDLAISLIQGFAGNPTAVPRCSTLDFLDIHVGEPSCSPSARIGTANITAGDPDTVFNPAVYNLEPPPGAVAKIGFIITEVPITIEVRLSQSPPYEVIASQSDISNIISFYSAEVELWGVPADPAHDKERGGPANIAPKPFITLPRACEGPLETFFKASSWEGAEFAGGVKTHDESEPPQPFGFTGCAKLAFSPRAAAKPTTDQAESPTGLDVELDIEDEGLANPSGIAASDIKTATLALPEGVTANPSVAEGLVACSSAQYEEEALDSEPGEGCPEASKVGRVEVETPLLEEKLLEGQLFIAAQNDNPFNSLLALYIVIKDPELGIIVKQAGRIEPDPKTGQLITTFGEPGEELPQFPLSHVRFHLRSGGRSPLISPPLCGTYTSTATLTPWANPENPLVTTSQFKIEKGVGGGPCPGAAQPFEPGFQAGTIKSSAGQYSPLYMRLTRRDGDQDLTKLSATLAPGLLGKLAGLSRCPEAQIALAKTKTGKAELASPSCPQSSQIGRTNAGAGVGSQLTYVPGSLYLAGPYKGAPFSVVSITPAVAGPFDVGTVVVRFALQINPQTAVATVDGAASDPIPHILAGIPLRVRDLRAYADRSQFTLNPTDCDPFAITAQIWGGGVNPFSAADDSPVTRSAPFQASNCASLGFKPRFDLRLKGGTKRGGHPALRAEVTPRSGDANFKKTVVTLPRSAFLDQAHIRTICTRVQFAAAGGNGAGCPAASAYGYATATTPILSEPVRGSVFLRSSNHNLPDLVMALKGPPEAPVDVEISARLDSHKGGIRASFEAIPDVPVSKFVLTMQGGKKGLIVNSRDLCAHSSRATARLTGQNGAPDNFSPLLRPTGCGGGNQASHRR